MGEQQTFIGVEFDLKEKTADVESAIHHLRWDLLKLRGLKNEVENGYLLLFGRDWLYERDFLKKARQFTSAEEEIVVIYVGNSAQNSFVQLSNRCFHQH